MWTAAFPRSRIAIDGNGAALAGREFQPDPGHLLPETIYERLLKVDYRNARFNRMRIYFSCNYPGTTSHFMSRHAMLKGFGHDTVSAFN
jgi:hypothetical protein